jgi:hypothetical protein
MRPVTKIAIAALGVMTALPAFVALAGAGAANAAETPTLDTAAYVSHTAGCTPGVTTHTDYKWVPDVNGSGSTMWTVNNFPNATKTTFVVKGANVAYHRDGDKTTQASDSLCGVDAATKLVDSTHGCSVTIPYVQGVNTFLYGVNGHPQTEAITSDVTVSAGLNGDLDTAPQFWIGYQAKPGYVIENLSSATTHIDFYNGDDIPDCTA